jgi:omega-6 fatty acid desaturase (delta-12 desaturase)
VDEARLRAELRAFVTPSTARGLRPVLTDVTVYVCMFPALQNPTLLPIEHNHCHHQAPNVKGLNSCSPLSHDEFKAMRPWRRRLERFYRSGLASGPYYVVERWWRAKLFPRAAAPMAAAVRRAAVRDLILLLGWFALFVAARLLVAKRNADPSPWLALLHGFAVPFAVWNVMMGCTVYYQHAHPQVPWFRTRDEADAFGGQHRRTVTILHSRLWGLLTHEIMAHNAHHVHPLIPHYRLRAAQRRLRELAEPAFLAERLTPAYVIDGSRRCKLYDYDRHCWLHFDRRTTSAPNAAVPSSAIA